MNELRLSGQVAAGHWVWEFALCRCQTLVGRTHCDFFGLCGVLFRTFLSRHELGLAFAIGEEQLFFDLGNTRDLCALV